METTIYLPEVQQLALEKLRELVLNNQTYIILALGPDVMHARIYAFVQFEPTLIGQVHDHLATSMSTRYVSIPEEDLKDRSLVLSVNTFE